MAFAQRGCAQNRTYLIGQLQQPQAVCKRGRTDSERAGEVNALLHAYNEYVIGRMGIPYRARKISLISVAMDAPGDLISALSGKIGRLEGVAAKTAYSNVISKDSGEEDA